MCACFSGNSGLREKVFPVTWTATTKGRRCSEKIRSIFSSIIVTAAAPPSGQFSLGFSFAAEESAVATAAKNGQPRKKKGTNRNYHESHESVKIKFSFCPAGKVSVQVPVTGFGSVGTFSSGGSRRFPQNPPSRVALGRNKRNFSQSATADLAPRFSPFVSASFLHTRKKEAEEGPTARVATSS